MHLALDLIGIFAFAVSGALLAIRRDFDVVGIAILSMITALGGGLLRDLVLGDTPPPAFTQWEYLAVPLAASAVAFVAHPELERLTQPCSSSMRQARALCCWDSPGARARPAVDRRRLPRRCDGRWRRGPARCHRTRHPLVRPDSELYAVPAVGGALGIVIAWELDAYDAALGAAIAVAIFAVRGLALRRHWHGSRAWQRRGIRSTRKLIMTAQRAAPTAAAASE